MDRRYHHLARPSAPASRNGRLARLLLLGVLCIGASACSAPVSAVRVDRTVAHRELTRSAVTTGEPSWSTRDVLLERGLLDVFAEQPEAAIEALHRAMVATGGDPDMLFALAELSALYGEDAGRRDHQLAAVVYAWAFLFPEDGDARPGPFDPRFRVAADLYNWSLTAAFESKDGDVVPTGGTFTLPFGQIAVAFDPAELRAGDRVCTGSFRSPSSRWRDSPFAIAGASRRWRRPRRRPRTPRPAATSLRRASGYRSRLC
jgi:hypothetical protein